MEHAQANLGGLVGPLGSCRAQVVPMVGHKRLHSQPILIDGKNRQKTVFHPPLRFEIMDINRKLSRTVTGRGPNRRGCIVNPTVKATANAASVTSSDIVRNVSLVRDEMNGTVAKIDARQMTRLAGHVAHPGRIFVAGAGRSGLVLRMAGMRLMHLGRTVHIAGDTTTPAIASGDLLLVASGSGTTSGVVKSAETAAKAGARIAAFTTNPDSPLAGLADALVVIPAAQKTDHGSSVTRQYSGSLFEQALFVATEAIFQSLWDKDAQPAEELWLRHANLE